jgi:hypothetical protein
MMIPWRIPSNHRHISTEAKEGTIEAGEDITESTHKEMEIQAQIKEICHSRTLRA